MSPQPRREPQDDGGPVPCPPCRGTGKLISSLHGEPHEVTCPWCGGSGTFQPGHDAQQAEHPDPNS